MVTATVPRPLQLAERAAERFNFTLVRIPLALEGFQRLENFLHVLEGFLQRTHNVIYLLDRALDARLGRRMEMALRRRRRAPRRWFRFNRRLSRPVRFCEFRLGGIRSEFEWRFGFGFFRPKRRGRRWLSRGCGLGALQWFAAPSTAASTSAVAASGTSPAPRWRLGIGCLGLTGVRYWVINHFQCQNAWKDDDCNGNFSWTHLATFSKILSA